MPSGRLKKPIVKYNDHGKALMTYHSLKEACTKICVGPLKMKEAVDNGYI